MFKFLPNIAANTSAFSKASDATVPSSLDNGGNECVEKLEPIDFAKDQKDLIYLKLKSKEKENNTVPVDGLQSQMQYVS